MNASSSSSIDADEESDPPMRTPSGSTIMPICPDLGDLDAHLAQPCADERAPTLASSVSRSAGVSHMVPFHFGCDRGG